MSHNTFGHLFRVTTWGESHGPAIGCVVDGTPPGIALSEADIQPFLNKRRPGQSKFTTQRQEADQVKILSGVYEGKTTGTPISLLIENTDQRSKDYANIAAQYRPGHADVTYDMKYGHRDPRGGGRSSARETAMRVAAGAIARKVLGDQVKIRGAMVALGAHQVDRARWDWALVDQNPFFCPDAAAALEWETILDGIRKAGSSIGAVLEVVAEGVPPGLGAPIYAAAALRGEENADEMRMEAGHIKFLANHAGGILGGIATGQPIVARFAVKPTSSILTPVRSVSAAGEEVEIFTKGRHDPCVGIRAVPVGEAMLACVLADHLLRHRAQIPPV
jgi:chorismate synthase